MNTPQRLSLLTLVAILIVFIGATWSPRMTTIAITTPVAYQTFQRDGSYQSNIPARGTATGADGLHVQARFNSSGAWTRIATIASNGWSGTLSHQAAGQGTFEVRIEEDTAVTVSKASVGIGVVLVSIGDSICAGRLSNNQTSTANRNGIQATAYNGSTWGAADDPTKSGEQGSFWPHVGTELVKQTASYPVAFINAGVGSTGIYRPSTGTGAWVKGQSAYSGMATAITNAAIGSNPPAGFLVHLGANDAADPNATASQASYLSLLTTLIGNLRSDYPGATVLLAQVGEVTTGSPPDRSRALDHVRAATMQAWSVTGAAPGPVLYDIPTDDGVHYKTDAHGDTVSQRWTMAILNALFSAGHGRGTTALDAGR